MKIKRTLLICFFVFLFCIGTVASNGIYSEAKQIDDWRIDDLQDGASEIHSHCICGGNSEVGDHQTHENVYYSPWNGGDFNYNGEDGNTGTAYLYLTEDVVNNANSCNRVDGSGIFAINTDQTLYLCLNGHSIKNGKTDNNVFDVFGTIVLCDCAGEGTIGGRISGANSGAIWLSNGTFHMYGGSLTGSCGVKNGAGVYAKDNSHVVMYGGEIKGNTAARQAGGVFLTGTSDFIMYDGLISENSAPDFGGGVIVDNGTSFTMNGGRITNNYSGSKGGGVFVSGGKFIMNGGTISDNRASYGGGVCTTYDYGRGSFTMNGGTISGNTAYASGGGVYIWDRATFSMNNGVISDNRAEYGGGICLYSAEGDKSNVNNVLEVFSGEIKGNTAYRFGGGVCCFQYSVLKFDGNDKIVINENTDSNLYFADKCTFTVNKLSEDSIIGVSSHIESAVICSSENVDFEKYFFSDNLNYAVKASASGMILTTEFYTSRIIYETGCDKTIPAGVRTGASETIDIIIPEVNLTKPCHRFLGWTDDSASEVVRYNSGDKLPIVGEITLYAVWESTPHKLTEIPEVRATCEEDGVMHHYECSECNKKFIDSADGSKTEVTDDMLVLAKGHKFGAWIDTVPATTEKEGAVAHKDCEVCGKHFDENGLEMLSLTIDKLPEQPEPPKQPEEEKSSLSTGGIVGTTIGITAISLLALEGLAYLVFKLVLKKKT